MDKILGYLKTLLGWITVGASGTVGGAEIASDVTSTEGVILSGVALLSGLVNIFSKKKG